MSPNPVSVTLTLKISTHFLHMTLWLIRMSHHYGFGYKIKSSAIQKLSFKLTLIEIFNLGCDINLEHSYPIFSVHTFVFL